MKTKAPIDRLQQVAALRQRRARRAWEASIAERNDARDQRDAAEAARAQALATAQAASAQRAADPVCEQTRVWLAVTQDRAAEQTHALTLATDTLNEADARVAARQTAVLRADVRHDAIADRARADRRAAARRQEERAADDMPSPPAKVQP